MIMKRFISFWLYIGVSLIFLSLFSCVNEDLNYNGGTEEDSDNIRISATISETISTRLTSSEVSDNKYIESGKIDQGEYILVYRSGGDNPYYEPSNQFSKAKIKFGYEDDPYTGFATYEEDGKTKSLKWKHAALINDQALFFLHNIYDDYLNPYSNQSPLYIELQPESHPFYASPLDIEHGKNDLLIGDAQPEKETSLIEIHLKHMMSLICVNIEVYKDEETDEFPLDLCLAKVYLTQVYKDLGGIWLDKEGKSTVSHGYTKEQRIYLSGDWAEDGEIGAPEDKEKRRTYSLPEFVFPPQEIGSGTDRTKLVVEVPLENITKDPKDKGQYKTFSAPLPQQMFETIEKDVEGNTVTSAPIALSFLSGYKLHLTATFNAPMSDMTFLPAQVEEWVDKANHNISASQAGIYKASDFYELIELYKQGKTTQLERYGYKLNGKYYFQLWGDISLEKERILDAMNNRNLPFEFIFNGYTVTVDDKILSGVSGQIRLHDIVTGETTSNVPGIGSYKDLKDMISAFKDNKIEDLSKYGAVNNLSMQWEFDILGSFTVDNLSDIYQQMDNSNYQDFDVKFNYGENTVSIKIGDSGNVLECNSSSITDILGKICVKQSEPMISSLKDFRFFKDIFNMIDTGTGDDDSDETKLLRLFMTYDENIWNLKFKDGLTFKIEDVGGSLISNYSGMTIKIANDNGVIHIEDQVIVVYNMSDNNQRTNLQNILCGTGSVPAYNFGEFINAYNHDTASSIMLWHYGLFDSTDSKWKFRMSPKDGINCNDIKGKMIPEPENKKYDFYFEFPEDSIYLNNIPTENGETINSVEITKANSNLGNEILHGILTNENYIYDPSND